MAPHSSTLAWKIPCMEEPGRLQSMGSLRVGHDWVTSLSLFTFMHWRRKWQPTPVFLPGESQGQGSLVGCRLWVTQSRTRLKQLNSSSSSSKTQLRGNTTVRSYAGWNTESCLWEVQMWFHVQRIVLVIVMTNLSCFLTLSYFLNNFSSPVPRPCLSHRAPGNRNMTGEATGLMAPEQQLFLPQREGGHRLHQDGWVQVTLKQQMMSLET